MQNFNRPMREIFCQEPRFPGSFRHSQKTLLKINLAIARTNENVAKIRDLVHSGRRLTVRTMEEQLNLTHTTVHRILIDELDMNKIFLKMVSKNLSQNYKRREIYLDLAWIENNPRFLKRVITDPGSFSTTWKRNFRAKNVILHSHQD